MTDDRAISRAEFELAYAERSGMTVEQLREHGRVVVRCWCGEPECEGWASVSAEAASDYEPGGIYHRVQSSLGAQADAFAVEFESKAARARLSFVRRWYERRAGEARKIASRSPWLRLWRWLTKKRFSWLEFLLIVGVIGPAIHYIWGLV